jgi:hypothetical protein
MNIHTKTHYVVSGKVPSDISKTDFRKSIIGYEISHFEIENCLTDRLVHDLRVEQNNPLIQAGPGSVVFMVSGYDSDPREIYLIPEVVAFMRKANESNPCWIYFAAPESGWLQNVAYCVLKSSHVSAVNPGHRTLAFLTHEIADFIEAQLDDFYELCSIARIRRRKRDGHLKLVIRGFGVKIP